MKDDMERSLFDQVAQVLMISGTVRVLAAPGLVARGLHLTLGNEAFALTPHAAPERKLQDFTLRPQQSATLWIRANELTDWMIPGGTTHQIEVLDRFAVHSIPFEPLPLPQTGGQAMSLRARIAQHRAVVELELRQLSAAGDIISSQQIPFEEKPGGTEASSFQDVSLTIQPRAGAAAVALVINYQCSSFPEEPYNPFIFVADPVLMEGAAPAGGTPDPLYHGPVIADAVWLEARVPKVRAAGQPLALVAGGQQMVLLQGNPIRVEVAESQGHGLRLVASEPIELRLLINDRLVETVTIGPDGHWLRLPVWALNGELARLDAISVRGMVSHLSDWMIPPRVLTPLEVIQRESAHPFEAQIFAQSAHRYEALRAHLQAGSPPDILAQLPHVIKTLEAGHDNVRLAPLALPEVDTPEVSIIIPAHNKVEVTYACLAALLLAWNRTSYEVILVDDGSEDDTARIEDWVSGLRILRNPEPQRFIRACNAGVAMARGRYVALLNNDTEPTTGWLDELLDGLRRFPGAGMVGAKLLYPDGRLQDAGGIIWGSGNPWNYGHGQNPWEPRFCYARKVDYLSGAALLLPREVWETVGGLSKYLEPMYFEDTDLAFKVREAGYSTWFIPASIVYHYEGMTSGTDTSAGYKRFQEVNRPKFKKRWARAYAGHGTEAHQPDLEKDRGVAGRVLFIDYQLPRADRDAGSYAALQEIRLVQSLGFKVTFLPENLADLGRYRTELQRMGVEVVVAPYTLSIDEFLRARAHEFDLAYLTRYHVAETTVGMLRRYNPQIRILLNNADLHFLRVLRTALAAGDTSRTAEIDTLRQSELAAMRSVDLVLSYNEVEHAVIQSHTNGLVRVAKCPWIADLPASSPPLDSSRAGLSFLGSYQHHPNAEGIAWFVASVMPLLAARSDIQLSLYGSGMPAAIKALAAPQVKVVGFVDTVDLAFDAHRIFIAPLLSGAGIKGKVVSALAHGIPCILSPVAAEGIGLRDGHDCLIARTPEQWAEAILRLHDDLELCARLAANARAHVESNFSFARGREDMRAAFEAVDVYCALD